MPYRVVKSGGAIEPLVSAESIADTGTLELIALDDTHVYWSASGGPSFGYLVLRAPKTGGEPTVVTDAPGPNLAVPTGIAVDADYVYVTQPDLLNSPANGVVRRVPKAGGPVLDIAQAFTRSVAVSDSYVYYARLTNNDSDELVRADKDGGNPQVIASEFGPIFDVQVEGDRVFWNSSDAGAYIVRTALEGGATTTLYSETGTENFPGAPAVTAGALYWLRAVAPTWAGCSASISTVRSASWSRRRRRRPTRAGTPPTGPASPRTPRPCTGPTRARPAARRVSIAWRADPPDPCPGGLAPTGLARNVLNGT